MAKTAICIGINDYPGTGSDLSGCVNDAKDWSDALRTRGFTTTLLLDAQATRSGMLAGMSQLVEPAKEGDTVVITYSGHGTWVPDTDDDESDGRDEALCPYDLNTVGALIDDDLHDLFASARRGVRLVFISDSCHSGTVARIAPLVAEDSTHKIRFLPPESFLKGAALQAAISRRSSTPRGRSRKTALTFSGCTDREYSYDARFNGRANGAFTFAALRALRDGATYHDWFKSIRGALPSRDYPQSPQLTATRAQRAWKVFA